MNKKSVLLSLFFSLMMVVGMANFYNSVDAKQVKDDSGQWINIPDKYFTQPQPTRQELQDRKLYNDKVLYYLNNPDKKISGEIAKDFRGIENMNDYAHRLMDAPAASLNGVKIFPTLQDSLNYLKSIYRDPYESIEADRFGFLDTEGVQLQPNNGYAAILKPSDITVYNKTGRENVKLALEKTFSEWEKDPKFHFRFVDNPEDARVIVSEGTISKSGTEFEDYVNAKFRINAVYFSCLIQGEIQISPELEQMSADDPVLNHTLTHEFGHVLGLGDLL